MEYSFNEWNYKINRDYKNPADLFEVISVKHPEVPTELFHYYTIDSKNVDALINHYIYANHPREFNDPFDCNRNLISFDSTSLEDLLNLNNDFSEIYKSTIDVDEITRLYSSKDPKEKSDLYDQLTWRLSDVLYENVGIFCMSGRNNSMGMWSYYSNHRGFVIKYSLNKLPVNHWGPFPINYTNNYKTIDYSIFKNSSFIYQSNIKAKCWEHENEWRLIFHGPDIMKLPNVDPPKAHNRKFFYNPIAIEEIILGYNFFESNEYDRLKSDTQNRYVRLRKKVTLKSKILKYIIGNGYKVSMIHLVEGSSFDLRPLPIEINMLSSDKYLIKYVD